jgi:DNA-binding winged helix-turn-helix (wHTH) protein
VDSSRFNHKGTALFSTLAEALFPIEISEPIRITRVRGPVRGKTAGFAVARRLRNVPTMTRTPCREATLRFGPFELDGNLFELRSGAMRVPVQPKVLRLLFYLVRNRDRTLSSEELRKALWPNETVTVASLKRAIYAARQALCDTGRSQSIIRTVRGHGYRFVVATEPKEPAVPCPAMVRPGRFRAAAHRAPVEALRWSPKLRRAPGPMGRRSSRAAELTSRR